jgi:UDP-3-O-[3-hydroxymyristoyl] glucosamine N-acyltransferase
VARNKKYTLGELASLLDARLVGDSEIEISGLATLSSAGQGDLSFLSKSTYLDQLAACKASAVIVEEKYLDSCPSNALVCSAPYVCFAHATALFDTTANSEESIHATAVIHPEASLGNDVAVGAYAVIGADVSLADEVRIEAGCIVGEGVKIGKACILHSGVNVYHGVTIGADVIIHSGTVIGSDGFGFAFDGTRSIKIHQLGGVVIGDDVEIGAGSTIDRGALGDTVIEQGVKLDNQVHIGHNCIIGEHTIICGCSALGGSTIVGKYCVLGGGTGIIGHLTIADRVQVSARTLISKSISEPGMYSSGTGQMKALEWKRSIVRFEQLDTMAKRLKALEKSSGAS